MTRLYDLDLHDDEEDQDEIEFLENQAYQQLINRVQRLFNAVSAFMPEISFNNFWYEYRSQEVTKTARLSM